MKELTNIRAISEDMEKMIATQICAGRISNGLFEEMKKEFKASGA